jgi:hypothetical protein
MRNCAAICVLALGLCLVGCGNEQDDHNKNLKPVTGTANDFKTPTKGGDVGTGSTKPLR